MQSVKITAYMIKGQLNGSTGPNKETLNIWGEETKRMNTRIT